MNNNRVEFQAVLMLLILNEFGKIKNEIRGVSKLFFLTTILLYPSKFNEMQKKLGLPPVAINDAEINNVELAALNMRGALSFDGLYASLGRLIGKELATINRAEGRIIITDTGKKFVDSMDEFEWFVYKQLTQHVKKSLGGMSAPTIKEHMEGIFPPSFVREQ